MPALKKVFLQEARNRGLNISFCKTKKSISIYKLKRFILWELYNVKEFLGTVQYTDVELKKTKKN